MSNSDLSILFFKFFIEFDFWKKLKKFVKNGCQVEKSMLYYNSCCGSAGIGRQARLRILWVNSRVGSSPISRIYKSEFDSERKQIRIFVIPVKSYSESTRSFCRTAEDIQGRYVKGQGIQRRYHERCRCFWLTAYGWSDRVIKTGKIKVQDGKGTGWQNTES